MSTADIRRIERLFKLYPGMNRPHVYGVYFTDRVMENKWAVHTNRRRAIRAALHFGGAQIFAMPAIYFNHCGRSFDAPTFRASCEVYVRVRP